MGFEQETASFKKLICSKEGERVWYCEKTDGSYEVYNQSKNELLGTIENMRVGKFMQWCFCPEGDMFFTTGCLREITEFVTKCYSHFHGKGKQ